MTKVTDLIERLKDDSSDFVYHERHEAAAELLRLSSECEALRKAVKLAATWFDEYALLHRAKGTTDGNDKGQRNQDRADLLRITLQETNGGGNADVS